MAEGDSEPDAASSAFLFGDAHLSAAHPESETDRVAAGLRIAKWWLKARRLREEVFGADMFSDPAWDILLDLYAADAKGERVQITSLSVAARVPHSTAIRWARIMTRAGLLIRERDPKDGRRIHISLSPETRKMMKDYLDRISLSAKDSHPSLTSHPG